MSPVLHRGLSCFLCDDRGDVAPDAIQGFFHREVRFLSRCRLTLDGRAPIVLGVRPCGDEQALHVLTNPTLDGAPRETLTIERRWTLGDALRLELVLRSFGDRPARCELALELDADFALVYDVKPAGLDGRAPQRSGAARREVDGGRARFTLDQGDARWTLQLELDPAPRWREAGPRYALTLRRDEPWRVVVTLTPRVVAPLVEAGPHLAAAPLAAPRLESDHAELERAYLRATQDWRSLTVSQGFGGRPVVIGGVPFFMTLFARDAIIAANEALLHDPAAAASMLERLADLQGRRHDPATAEEPGRIPHAYRPWPLPGDHPHLVVPLRYTSIDSTPLFLVLLGHHARVTGDLTLARRLRPAIEGALGWIDGRLARDPARLLSYDEEAGARSEGWKDSGDAVRQRDGTVVRPPITLAQVQGYVCHAWRQCAAVLGALGEGALAARLRRRAEELAGRVRDLFWMADRGCFAQALGPDRRPTDGVTSDGGHLLWSGVASAEQARRTAEVLLSAPLFSGYGVRTRAADERGYDPISYHNGSVWPHDNAIIVAGLRRYGLVEPAARVTEGLLRALAQLGRERLPEVFAGYDEAEHGVPLRYPGSDAPQAFAVGAVLSLTRAILGVDVDALAGTVRLRPLALPGLRRLALRGAYIAQRRCDVELTTHGGRAHVEVHGLPDGLRIVVE